ncbi:hypothetical protein BDF22DRAFT_776611 [Syncephalis plumigaleata]|nr:hypothetical protein BDF22DRAFT_776611 [Syncephalis plumigaleata]
MSVTPTSTTTPTDWVCYCAAYYKGQNFETFCSSASDIKLDKLKDKTQLATIYRKIEELSQKIASPAPASTNGSSPVQLDASVMIDELTRAPKSQLFLLEQQALELAAEIQEKSQRIINGATDIASAIASASSVADNISKTVTEEPSPQASNTGSNGNGNGNCRGASNLVVMCDGCGELSKEYAYTCLQCDDFDFCHGCYNSSIVRAHHPAEHQFMKITCSPQPHSPTYSSAAAQPSSSPTELKPSSVTASAWCDFCDTLIAGYRYKCEQCPDFDLCGKCIGRAVSHHNSHTYKVIEAPKDSSSESRSWLHAHTAPVRHTNVICDHCNRRIVGVRYKCGNCSDLICVIKRPLPYPISTSTALLPSLYMRRPISTGSICAYQISAPKASCNSVDTLVNTPSTPKPSDSLNLPGSFVPAAGIQSPSTSGQATTPELYTATFINDASVDDGTVFSSGETNHGTIPWPTGVKLIYVGGDRMGDVTSVDMPVLASNEQAPISVDLVAPKHAGLKTSYWRLVQADGLDSSDTTTNDTSFSISVEDEDEDEEDEEEEEASSNNKSNGNQLSNSALFVIPTLSFSNVNTDDEDGRSTITSSSVPPDALTSTSASEIHSLASSVASLTHGTPAAVLDTTLSVDDTVRIPWSESDIEISMNDQSEIDVQSIVSEDDIRESTTSQPKTATADAATDLLEDRLKLGMLSIINEDDASTQIEVDDARSISSDDFEVINSDVWDHPAMTR